MPGNRGIKVVKLIMLSFNQPIFFGGLNKNGMGSFLVNDSWPPPPPLPQKYVAKLGFSSKKMQNILKPMEKNNFSI